jgi:LuxR family maltose regulon positive regulatory protein
LTTHPLTLLSAPAGYGKTSLLAALPKVYPRLALAWLTLDEDDNDPARFLAALIAALRRLHPDCGATAQAVLDSLPDPAGEVRRVISVLINDILEILPEAFALVLDDLEVIQGPAVYAALEHLLDRLPPQMHLALASRRDPPLPLARLRARGQIVELRLADLRFGLEEAQAFLSQELKSAPTPATVALLRERTEGWPAGLRLLVGSLERIPSPAGREAFIERLAQTDRFASDFLAEEVLNRQEADLQTFLLQTSILEELTPALCRAVTGREDADRTLDTVYRRNLFVVKLDTVEATYRYHALFAEFLERELRRRLPEQLADLHLRAAEACQADEPERAIRHYLKVGLDERAAAIIEGAGASLLRQGLVNTLHDWLAALPASLRDVRPQLLYLRGLSAYHKRELDEAGQFFERAWPGFEASGDLTRLGKCLASLADVTSFKVDAPRTRALIERALACSPPSEEQVRLIMIRMRMDFFMGQVSRLEQDLSEAFRIARAAEEPAVFGVLLQNLIPGYLGLPGILSQTEAVCHQCEQAVGKQPSPIRLAIAIPMALVHFYRGRLDRAIETAEEALTLNERLGGGAPLLLPSVQVVKGWSYLAQGQFELANRALQEAYRQLSQVAPDRSQAVLYVIAATLWRQGRLPEAREVSASLLPRLEALAQTVRLHDGAAMLTAWQALADGRYAEAEVALRQAIRREQELPMFNPWGGSQPLLAYVYLKWGRPDQALAEFVPVLAQCERDDTPGLILLEGSFAMPLLELAVERGQHVPFARRWLEVLRGASGPRPIALPGTGETLTAREVQVLRLVASGASNQAIADKLFISLHTVKNHVAQLLAKLHVASRTEAAARARELGLH